MTYSVDAGQVVSRNVANNKLHRDSVALLGWWDCEIFKEHVDCGVASVILQKLKS